MRSMKMTVQELLCEIQSAFTPDFTPSDSYLLSEYNTLLRRLYLLLPDSDASTILTPVDGKLQTELLAEQVRRVFVGEYELLRASRTLFDVMADGRLYCPTDEGIFVTADADCTVYYRALPDAVTERTAETSIPLDLCYLPLVRAWMYHRAYLYFGDFDSADAYGTEYNRLLADYKAENGVQA